MNETIVPATPEFTDDRILGGRVVLRQPAKGYRAGLDAALLAAACDAAAGARVNEAELPRMVRRCSRPLAAVLARGSGVSNGAAEATFLAARQHGRQWHRRARRDC